MTKRSNYDSVFIAFSYFHPILTFEGLAEAHRFSGGPCKNECSAKLDVSIDPQTPFQLDQAHGPRL